MTVIDTIFIEILFKHNSLHAIAVSNNAIESQLTRSQILMTIFYFRFHFEYKTTIYLFT